MLMSEILGISRSSYIFFMENPCLKWNGVVGLGAVGLGVPRKHSLV